MVKSKINILSEDVVGKISAGEVVERPASVVKELVENSIDSGADSIEIEVQGAGQTLIRVADNGEGMSEADAKIACMRHATSKIKDINDLNNIRTMGFRGEALFSITSVSQVDLISRSEGAETGVYVYMESGEVLKTRPIGRSRGTTIEVRNLFYNVPARRKFLKKESTELSEIVNVIGRFVIAYPDIDIKLTHGTRCLLHAAKGMSVVDRIGLVLGTEVSESLIGVNGSNELCKITGYVSRPSSTRKDKKANVFFVNNRYIRSKTVSDGVIDAYRSMLERGRYPSAVLFLDIQPSEVDVNVHPSKLLVKFGDDKKIKDAVESAVSASFVKVRDERTVMTAGKSVFEENITGLAGPAVVSDGKRVQDEFKYDVQRRRSLDRGEGSLAGVKNVNISAERSRNERPEEIFQIGGCYIIQIKHDSVTVTDQHAAHERVLYEFFSSHRANAPIETQNLLFPVRLDLSLEETVLMEKVAARFGELGFQIESFGERSFVIRTVPAILKDRDVKTVILDILGDLSSRDLTHSPHLRNGDKRCGSGSIVDRGVGELTKTDAVDELIKLTSCKAAIKAGDPLGKDEMYSLLDQLKKCALPFTCPHGRPTVLDITTDELEKRFRRK